MPSQNESEIEFPVEGFEPEEETEFPVELSDGLIIDPRTDPLNSRGLQPNEKALKILLETDEIPERVKDIMWSTSSRHLELLDASEYDLADYDIMIRDLHRHARWSKESRKISPLDLRQNRKNRPETWIVPIRAGDGKPMILKEMVLVFGGFFIFTIIFIACFVIVQPVAVPYALARLQKKDILIISGHDGKIQLVPAKYSANIYTTTSLPYSFLADKDAKVYTMGGNPTVIVNES